MVTKLYESFLDGKRGYSKCSLCGQEFDIDADEAVSEHLRDAHMDAIRKEAGE